mgnify:CR=1 FL=1
MRVEMDDPEADWTRPGVFEVAPEVFRIPLPLPQDGLHAVNVYALRDGDGLTLIDAGWTVGEARELLEKALAALDCGVSDVRRFLVTHAHRDHYTLAVTLRREYGNRVSLGVGEQPNFAVLTRSDATLLGMYEERLTRCGARSLLDWLRQVSPHLPHDPENWSEPDEWLVSGQEVSLAARTLQVVETPGHTRGHVVFVDRAAELMFAGDHVLPHITPSIGFEAALAELPLADYLGSLRLVRELPDRRLLPAHGPVAPSVHSRVDELLRHHERRLDQTWRAVGNSGATAWEVAGRLTWTRRERLLVELDPFNQLLAALEASAHLDLLAAQGRLKFVELEGVRHYEQP